ncbi:MAG: hypothetical protein WB989_23760, partial [Mycobacterium sp.]
KACVITSTFTAALAITHLRCGSGLTVLLDPKPTGSRPHQDHRRMTGRIDTRCATISRFFMAVPP